MNKKAQIPAIIVFAVVIIILVMAAPFIIKLVVVPVSKVSTAFQTVDPTNKTSQAITGVQTTFTSMFDWVVAFFFMFNVIILLLSAFLVDVHPAFLIIYIIAAFFLIVFAPSVMDVVNNIYTSASFSVGTDNVVQYLPIMSFINNNFGVILVGIIIISGLILFGKYRLGSAGKSGGGTQY